MMLRDCVVVIARLLCILGASNASRLAAVAGVDEVLRGCTYPDAAVVLATVQQAAVQGAVDGTGRVPGASCVVLNG